MDTDNIQERFSITNERIGKGSYGNVKICSNEKGEKYAVKCCDKNGHGIPSVIEPVIMKQISHPYINSATRVTSTEKKLYILQKVAKGDVTIYAGKNIGLERIKKWCYMIASAVGALHAIGIIHCDIKGNNILVYEDDTVKLTDFTLSTVKWKTDEKFRHSVTTCTHRPLEVLTKKEWDESVDIWSLGCTFYEIAYGRLLFPYQGVIDKDKKKITDRAINCILDWCSVTSGENNTGIIKNAVKYIKFELSNNFHNSEMELFNRLLLKMLNIDKDKRPTIKEVIDDDFFSEQVKILSYKKISKCKQEIPFPEYARASRYIECYSEDKTIANLAMDMYMKCAPMKNKGVFFADSTPISTKEIMITSGCVWIATKLVLGYPPNKVGVEKKDALSAEIAICNFLDYKLL